MDLLWYGFPWHAQQIYRELLGLLQEGRSKVEGAVSLVASRSSSGGKEERGTRQAIAVRPFVARKVAFVLSLKKGF